MRFWSDVSKTKWKFISSSCISIISIQLPKRTLQCTNWQSRAIYPCFFKTNIYFLFINYLRTPFSSSTRLDLLGLIQHESNMASSGNVCENFCFRQLYTRFLALKNTYLFHVMEYSSFKTNDFYSHFNQMSHIIFFAWHAWVGSVTNLKYVNSRRPFFISCLKIQPLCRLAREPLSK